MSADLVATSLWFHAPICAASVLAIWKLCGESKFGTEKVNDLHGLRPKLLKSVVGGLELCLNPVLTSSSATESIEHDEDGMPKAMPARLSVIGKESLVNAVRDFVKSDSQGLLDLREAQFLDARLTQSLDRLRKVVWLLFGTSGLVCLLMSLGKFEWLQISSAWMHVVFLAAVVALLLLVSFLFWRILNCSTLVDRLKSQYADLS